MQVCHITSVHPRYDIRIFVKECKALADKCEISLIVADSLGNEVNGNISIYDVGKASGGRLKRMKVTAKAIFDKVLELKPKIVHFHDPELIGIGIKLSKLGYKIIYDVHEDVPKQVMNKHWIPAILRPFIAKFVEIQEKKASKLFAGVICATEIIAFRFKKYNKNTVAIHNYPILAELNQQCTTWDARKNHLCYLGSISATRGIIPLVNSLKISGLTLDLAGSYSNPQVEVDIANSNGYANVNYHGILNREGVSKLLSSVKIGMVTLLPTPSYVESLPIKLFEYMLSGIPVIASNFPLWKGIVEGNKCGFLVNPEDPEAIAIACQRLLGDQELAQEMGQNGKRAVLENYTWENELKRLLDFYAQLI